MKFINWSILLMAVNFYNVATATEVTIDTNLGKIVLELNDTKAPKTVANFLNYVKSGYYKNTVFHRVIKNFMIQGGGFNKKYKRKSTDKTITNEANNGLKNYRGTIAMARTNDPHSASAQFFINVKDNHFLDHTEMSMRGWGYAVFGKVTSGINIVDKIQNVKTGTKALFASNLPLSTIVINNITIN